MKNQSMKNQSNNPLRVASDSFFARLLGLAVVSGVVCVAASVANADTVSFTSSDTWTVPAGVTSVEYLVVGGGGGGGGQNGGGGGGGEFLTGTLSVTPGANIVVTVGAGGAVNGGGANNNRGSRGGSSFFGTIEAKGGGGGGGANIGQGEAGINTSSAGGNGWGTGPGSARSVGGGVGYGDGGLNGGNDRDGGGGGGAGGDGGNGLNDQGGGFGGAGLSSSISGSLQWYAGGGGGAARTNAQSPGGIGGGGAGGYGWGAPVNYAQPGTPNTGGGGGGADDLPGIGGSGIVVLKFATSTPYVDWISKPEFGVAVADRGTDKDPDLDGQNNLVEFALDGHPSSGAATGKTRSRIETVGSEQALVITLPVRGTASAPTFSGTTSKTATVDGVVYTIEGSNELAAFDQGVTEVTPASDAGMPTTNPGWSYRTFRLNGAVSARGARGFLRVRVEE